MSNENDMHNCADGLVADAHCHILDEKLSPRREEIVQGLRASGIEFVVEVGTGIEESLDVWEFAKVHEFVYSSLGVHPHTANEYVQEVPGGGTYGEGFENWMRTIMGSSESSAKVVALGECGLDYYHDLSPRDVQAVVFIRQIKLSHELGLPLVVHSREAFDDTFRILLSHREFLQNGVLIHCFGYGADELRRFSESLDAYFSFGGAVTYKNATKLQEALRACPLDKILLETDAPYLAPGDLRGKVNEPKKVRLVAEFVARELGLTFGEVARITLANTRRFYRL